MKKFKIGVVGCGNISDIYLTNLKKFNNTEVVAVSDIKVDTMKAQAEKYEIKKMYSVAEMMADDEIEVVLILTNPKSHCEISLAALNANKHVYTEKSLGINVLEGEQIINTAKEKKLYVGCAPDTFMGGRLQTARKLIDDGFIGKVIGATAFMACHGHEAWHPSPEFYYKIGAGPMFDMGPYYVTALISLLGPATRVCGSAQKSFASRTITSEPLYGKEIEVDVPTHINGIIEFAKGASASIITSFDVWDSTLPRLEFYGSEGTLALTEADPLGGPNIYDGKILLRRKEEDLWNGYPTQVPRREAPPFREMPILFGYNENSRGLGLADMCNAIQTGSKSRANGDMALHALEIMEGIHTAAETGKYHEIINSCEQPLPMQLSTIDFKF